MDEREAANISDAFVRAVEEIAQERLSQVECNGLLQDIGMTAALDDDLSDVIERLHTNTGTSADVLAYAEHVADLGIEDHRRAEDPKGVFRDAVLKTVQADKVAELEEFSPKLASLRRQLSP